MKTKQEILAQPYVNITDIKTLLSLPRDKAKMIFMVCDEEEAKKPFRAHDRKVPLHSVLKTVGVTYAFLSKQIESLEIKNEASGKASK